MNKTVAVITLVMTLFAWKAYSGIELEPYVGYEFSDSDDDVNGNSSFTQLDLGARVGFSILMFSAGVDYMNGTGDGEFDDSTVEYDTTASELGAYFKFTFPILIQTYATYILDAELEQDYSSGSSFTLNGSGYKVGVGFTGLPFIAINLEYKAINYDEFESGSTTADIDADYSTYGVFVSLPLTF